MWIEERGIAYTFDFGGTWYNFTQMPSDLHADMKAAIILLQVESKTDSLKEIQNEEG